MKMIADDYPGIRETGRELSTDVFSPLILLICLVAAFALAIAGTVSFFSSTPTSRTITGNDLVEKVREGALPESYVRMAYDEVKRLANTPVDSQLQWNPKAAQQDNGLMIFGTVLDPKGKSREFYVQFEGRTQQIVASELEE
jgi:hypothetical protein